MKYSNVEIIKISFKFVMKLQVSLYFQFGFLRIYLDLLLIQFSFVALVFITCIVQAEYEVKISQSIGHIVGSLVWFIHRLQESLLPHSIQDFQSDVHLEHYFPVSTHFKELLFLPHWPFRQARFLNSISRYEYQLLQAC